MKELLKEYRRTLRETIEIQNSLIERINQVNNIPKNKRDYELLHSLQEDLKIVRSWISNLYYSISWLKTGRQPGNTRGIERRAAYEREIPFDPYWIQLKKEDDYITCEFNEEEESDFKQNLVIEMIKPLNQKEKEIFELAANDFSIREISNYLHIPKSTVSDTLKRCKRKIENEGWEIV
ncbi:sigma factor-like helix-turn-helix DNA-binding protein [Ureibacillus sp. FSL W8-0352]|uniref:sigma factor-like helix-turn-helix DNA-binding protein n=1 Tax=Ureibacillus sp. FSL W8-0352 TaxID=2954596 RepID=UPI0030F4C840